MKYKKIDYISISLITNIFETPCDKEWNKLLYEMKNMKTTVLGIKFLMRFYAISHCNFFC